MPDMLNHLVTLGDSTIFRKKTGPPVCMYITMCASPPAPFQASAGQLKILEISRAFGRDHARLAMIPRAFFRSYFRLYSPNTMKITSSKVSL